MKGIALKGKRGEGKLALVDDEDYNRLSKFKWYLGKRGYPEYSGYGREKKGRILLHHAIIGKPEKGYEVDHENRNRLDNRRSNLRYVTVKQNRENNSGQISASSKYRGISWSKRKKKWVAYGSKNSKYVHLGEYTDELKAAEIARLWRIEHMPNCGDKNY